MKRSWLLVAALALAIPLGALSQERPRRWQRRGAGTAIPVTVFHSTQSANLPTAETLAKGEFLFEISHRFRPAISEGVDQFWGLDGPVYNRFGLAYAVHDRVLVGVLRSNLDRNIDLSVKARIAEGGVDGTPWMAAAVGGVAFNPEPEEFGAFDERSVQYYGQGIFNILLFPQFALGVVPSYLWNVSPFDTEQAWSFTLGLNGQLYFSEEMSVFGEWIASEDHFAGALGRDAGSAGIEFETGGHFFKLMVTNSVRLNPSQFLGGTEFSLDSDEWRLGFNITRILAF